VPAEVGTNVGSVALSTGLAAAALDEDAVFVPESEVLKGRACQSDYHRKEHRCIRTTRHEPSLSSGEP
jgi:hypothetical protein